MARGWNTKGMSTQVRNLYDVKKLTDPIDVHNVFSLLSGGSILREARTGSHLTLTIRGRKTPQKKQMQHGIFSITKNNKYPRSAGFRSEDFVNPHAHKETQNNLKTHLKKHFFTYLSILSH